MASQYYNGGAWIRPERRLAIYLRDEFHCAYCGDDLHGASPLNVTLDHLLPKSTWMQMTESEKDCTGLKSVNDADNLVTSCRACNSSRGNKALQDFAPGGALNRITILISRALPMDLARSIINGTAGDPRLEVQA
jgi:5-methylcytosine-specific restriction endonuclease McrA